MSIVITVCLFAATFILECMSSINIPMPKHDPIDAIKGLIKRRLPSHVNQFSIKLIPNDKEEFDVFELDQINDKIRLSGSSASALGSCLNWYLKYYGLGHMSWNAENLNLPTILPKVTKKIRKERQSRYVYYQNVCTVSYSMWNWNWSRWEHHLDWMLLHGVNMPLAFTGQEKVWKNVFSKYFNISDKGIEEFFSGAAFLAWQRMGNLQGSWVTGPLPESFIEGQYQMQIKILKRMKEFGMIPAMPAFAGHVPREFQEKYPLANITIAPSWGGFKGLNTNVRTVEPTDPLFIEIGKSFIKEQKLLYPFTSSLYQMDTYNEMDPLSDDLEYLKNSSLAVFNSARAADPNAVWLMQGWLFQSTSFWSNSRIEAYLSSIPNNGLIILDLYSETAPIWKKTMNYFGKSWIYCVLHNFGGDLGLRGDLPSIASDLIDAKISSNGTFLGVGLTMEGIFQNYVVYELTLEMSWVEEQVDITAWLEAYADSRYGAYDENARKAWTTLGQSVYNCTRCYGGVPKNVIVWRPSFSLDFDGFMGSQLKYNSKDIIIAWNYLLQSGKDIRNKDTFLYDLVDITRQAISNRIYFKYKELTEAFNERKNVCFLGQDILKMIKDLQIILSCHKEFLLGKWIFDSRSLGETNEEKDYYEYQARNQITRWGENNSNAVNDYASKQWAGLMETYYYPRWNMFLNYICSQYDQQKPLNLSIIYSYMEKFEIKWQIEKTSFPDKSSGDAFDVSKELYLKYQNEKITSNNNNYWNRKNDICNDAKALIYFQGDASVIC